MNKDIFFKHPQGLGDFILYSGIIKNHFAKNYNKVYIDVPINQINNIKQLYEDTPNVIINSIPKNIETFNVNGHSPLPYYILMLSSFSKYKFDFSVKRNLNREKEFYNKVIDKIGPDYILTHYRPKDNMHRNLAPFNYDYIKSVNSKNLPLFNLDFSAPPKENYGLRSNNIFDYCTLIEKATQLHFYEGGFCCLADRFLPKDNNIKKYCHLYAKTVGAGPLAAKYCLEGVWHKNDWIYLK